MQKNDLSSDLIGQNSNDHFAVDVEPSYQQSKPKKEERGCTDRQIVKKLSNKSNNNRKDFIHPEKNLNSRSLSPIEKVEHDILLEDNSEDVSEPIDLFDKKSDNNNRYETTPPNIEKHEQALSIETPINTSGLKTPNQFDAISPVQRPLAQKPVNQSNDRKSRKSTDSSVGEDRIHSFIRIRPIFEEESFEKTIVSKTEDKKLLLKYRDEDLEYEFDHVYDTNTIQKEVFLQFKDYVKKLFSGRSLTILAYGQTGSGKTHSMFGVDSESGYKYDLKKGHNQQRTEVEIDISKDTNKMGLIPRILWYVYDLLGRTGLKAQVFFSFFQIYKEKVYDLQQNSQEALNHAQPVRDNNIDGCYIENLLTFECKSYEEALGLMLRGEENRFIRETNMNLKSSRAHTILQVKFTMNLPNRKILVLLFQTSKKIEIKLVFSGSGWQ